MAGRVRPPSNKPSARWLASQCIDKCLAEHNPEALLPAGQGLDANGIAARNQRHQGRHPIKAMPVPSADSSPAGEGEQGRDHPGERLQSSEQGHVLERLLGVFDSPVRRRSWDLHPLVLVAGLTLAVHAEGIEQAGAAELGAQEGHVQLHQPGLAVLCRQLQLAAAHPPAQHSLGVPTSPRLGQEAVHKVQLGLLDAVNEGVLWVQQSGVSGDVRRCPGQVPQLDAGIPLGTPSLTTCSLIWMQRDFFLTAATPVVKVLRMLVARRRASWEPPSSPATEPDSTSAEPPRPANRLLITFLQGTEGTSSPSATSPPCHAPTQGPCSLLGLLQQDRGVLGGRVVLDVVEPSRSIVLHPVGPRAVSQEEVSGFITGEQRVVPCRETQHQWAQPWG